MYQCPAVKTYTTWKTGRSGFFSLFHFLWSIPFPCGAFVLSFIVLSCTLNLLCKRNIKWYCSLETNTTYFSWVWNAYERWVAQAIQAKNYIQTKEINFVIIRAWRLVLYDLKEYILSITIEITENFEGKLYINCGRILFCMLTNNKNYVF